MKVEKQNLLIANDTDFLLLGYSQQLKLYFNVYLAFTGKDALELMEKKDPGFFKVIILDINMPVMGGIEAARQIQARYAVKPEHKPLIYFLSGDEMHDNREALAEIDYAAYFTRLTLEGEIKAILTSLR